SYDIGTTPTPDPLNPEFYDIYATRSTDSLAPGGTFSPNARVTPNTGPYPSLATFDAGTGNGFIGDYAGIAASVIGGVNYAHPVWTSGGFNGGQLQTATLQ